MVVALFLITISSDFWLISDQVFSWPISEQLRSNKFKPVSTNQFLPEIVPLDNLHFYLPAFIVLELYLAEDLA